MTRFILAMIRFLALIFSFLISSLAAATFLTLALFLGGEPEWFRNDPAVALGSVGFTFAGWVEISQSLFLPFLLVAAVAEFSRLTSFIFNILAGGGLALFYLVLTPYSFDLPYSQQEIWTAALAAGFVAGFAHWILAGCRAGRWLGPDPKQDLIETNKT